MAEVTKAASRERLAAEPENRATGVKECVAKRRATWEPSMGARANHQDGTR